jgi:choline-sulfatase
MIPRHAETVLDLSGPRDHSLFERAQAHALAGDKHMAQKNVVVIMSDEHDPRMMGCSGHPFVQTPNLDALAARGVRFTSAYTPSPICVPARAAFATGQRVHTLRLWDNAMPYTGEQRGWGHVLQQHGVRVESIGKLHYRNEEDPAGFDAEHLPMHVVGGHGMVWASIRNPYRPRADGPRMLGERIGPGESSYTQYDRAVTQRAVEWLQDAGTRKSEGEGERDGAGFVLYVGLVAPHFPLVVPEEFYKLYPPGQMPEPKLTAASGYQRHPWVQEYCDFMGSDEKFVDEAERLRAFSAYYGLCTWLDHNVGQILGALRAAGLEDSTQVVYTSDHGDNLGARGVWGKSTLYEESAKVPMLIAGPGIAPAVCETPVDLLDLFPTILQGAGIDPAPEMGDRPAARSPTWPPRRPTWSAPSSANTTRRAATPAASCCARAAGSTTSTWASRPSCSTCRTTPRNCTTWPPAPRTRRCSRTCTRPCSPSATPWPSTPRRRPTRPRSSSTTAASRRRTSWVRPRRRP